MDAAVLLTFAAASLVLAAAPGPDILYVLAQSAQSGARAGLAVVVGLMIGCLIQTAAAAAGLAAVVAASPWLFWTIRLAGAAYLVYLAWGAWHAPVSVGQTQAERISLAVLLRRGRHQPQGADLLSGLFPAVCEQRSDGLADGLRNGTSWRCLYAVRLCGDGRLRAFCRGAFRYDSITSGSVCFEQSFGTHFPGAGCGGCSGAMTFPSSVEF